MIPVLSPQEMNEVDRAAPEPVEVLIRRAAHVVALEARRALRELTGSVAGRRVVVLAGPGNNGEDGRVAARLLAGRGVHAEVIDALDAPSALPRCDLVIDAAFGTGLRSGYDFPAHDAPVLAVDIPSGIDGDTGVALGSAAVAERTVTFAALKPGLLLGDGPAHSGEVVVADIGLDVSRARMHLTEPDDAMTWVPPRHASAHKWRHAVRVVAGSPGMSGSAWLTSAAAMRAGASYVRLSSPGVDEPPAPVEAVASPMGEQDWSGEVLSDLRRFAAMAIGPGLGTAHETFEAVRATVGSAGDAAVVIDGDGLRAFEPAHHDVLHGRVVPAVLTPHDGEFEALAGAAVGPDRIGAVRDLARRTRSVVLLKGPTVVVADPEGQVLLCTAGDERLATAGTGDVLTGIIAAHLAAGASPLFAAGCGAQLHGDAAGTLEPLGLVAGDLLEGIVAARNRAAGAAART